MLCDTNTNSNEQYNIVEYNKSLLKHSSPKKPSAFTVEAFIKLLTPLQSNYHNGLREAGLQSLALASCPSINPSIHSSTVQWGQGLPTTVGSV